MRAVSALLLLGFVACRGDAGRLSVSWTGADSGSLRVPVRATWCPLDSVLEITGADGDSGIALALLPADSLAPGIYPVMSPGGNIRLRPQARVALRLFEETLVNGYYSISGAVTVDSARGLSGAFNAVLEGTTNGAQLMMEGRFRELDVEPGVDSCVSTPRSTPDTTLP